jgi:methyl-accepting chemotaxis protein
VVSEIAAFAEEEAFGLREVNSAVNQIDQSMQQNATMVGGGRPAATPDASWEEF